MNLAPFYGKFRSLLPTLRGDVTNELIFLIHELCEAIEQVEDVWQIEEELIPSLQDMLASYPFVFQELKNGFAFDSTTSKSEYVGDDLLFSFMLKDDVKHRTHVKKVLGKKDNAGHRTPRCHEAFRLWVLYQIGLPLQIHSLMMPPVETYGATPPGVVEWMLAKCPALEFGVRSVTECNAVIEKMGLNKAMLNIWVKSVDTSHNEFVYRSTAGPAPGTLDLSAFQRLTYLRLGDGVLGPDLLRGEQASDAAQILISASVRAGNEGPLFSRIKLANDGENITVLSVENHSATHIMRSVLRSVQFHDTRRPGAVAMAPRLTKRLEDFRSAHTHLKLSRVQIFVGDPSCFPVKNAQALFVGFPASSCYDQSARIKATNPEISNAELIIETLTLVVEDLGLTQVRTVWTDDTHFQWRASHRTGGMMLRGKEYMGQFLANRELMNRYWRH
jgi:hypothetical protein